MTRPWRLTRRQRVEMEAARAALALATDPRDILRASVPMGWAPRVSDRFPDDMRQWRLLRARVAIATKVRVVREVRDGA